MILTEAEMDGLWHDYRPMSCREYTRHVEAKLLAKLCAGVEMPEAVATKTDGGAYGGITLHVPWDNVAPNSKLFTSDQLRAYGAACRLKALEDAAVLSWSHHMDHSKKIGVSPDVYSRFSPTAAIRALKGEAP